MQNSTTSDNFFLKFKQEIESVVDADILGVYEQLSSSSFVVETALLRALSKQEAAFLYDQVAKKVIVKKFIPELVLGFDRRRFLMFVFRLAIHAKLELSLAPLSTQAYFSISSFVYDSYAKNGQVLLKTNLLQATFLQPNVDRAIYHHQFNEPGIDKLVYNSSLMSEDVEVFVKDSGYKTQMKIKDYLLMFGIQIESHHNVFFQSPRDRSIFLLSLIRANQSLKYIEPFLEDKPFDAQYLSQSVKEFQLNGNEVDDRLLTQIEQALLKQEIDAGKKEDKTTFKL